MTAAEFLDHPGRSGAFGSLMDEHAIVHLLRHRRQLERRR